MRFRARCEAFIETGGLRPPLAVSGLEGDRMWQRLAILLCCAFAGCNGTDPLLLPHDPRAAEPPPIEEPLPRVWIDLNWFPEAEHGGYYAALAHGYFAEEGVNVEIVPGGPKSPV